MYYKKASLIVDGVKYIYTVRGNAYDIKIIVYPQKRKIPYFASYVTYTEAWGFDVYSPKMIELLIRFYNSNDDVKKHSEFKTKDYKELFEMLFDVFFKEINDEERKFFRERCGEFLEKTT